MNQSFPFTRDILRKSAFSDKIYLFELYEEIKDYMYKCPTPIIVEWVEENFNIIFRVGRNFKAYKVSTFVSPRDFITSVEFWLCTYYPKYYIEQEVITSLTSEEKFKAITEHDLSLEESLDKRNISYIPERGMIIRIYLPDDKFTILVNGKKYIRLSGTINKPMPLSVFLKQLRGFSIGEDKREYFIKVKNFIEENSVIDNSDVRDKDIDISYTGRKLDNFIQINKRELCNHDPIDLSPLMVKIGMFTIIFESEEKKKEILLKINMYRTKRSLNQNVKQSVR